MKVLNSMISINDIQGSFKEMARYLFEECELVAGNNTYYFTELEFYYNSNTHNDGNVHCHRRQLTTNEFYFHSKGGKYACVDITFGSTIDVAYGGILIRGIKNKSINVSYPGPNLSLNGIKKSAGINKYLKPTELNGKSIDELKREFNLFLQESQTKRKCMQIHNRPRHNLSDSSDKYYGALYRYSI
jgi:hypothetical protein